MNQNNFLKPNRVKSKDKVSFNELIAPYTISNQSSFFDYLDEIWRDLSHRNENPLYINKLTFSSYYDLPGIISERLFAVFDTNNDQLLSRDEFLNGMKRLFTNDYDGLTKLIFDLYDFDKNRLISKEDIRIVLSYVSLSKGELCEMNYIDRVHSQEELEALLNESFLMFKSTSIDYEHFIDIIENCNSDVFFYIILFLYTKQPFTKAVLKEYDTDNQLKNANYFSKMKSMKNRKLALPNISCNFSPCSFLTAPLKHKSYQKNDVLSQFCENRVSKKSVSKFIQFKTQTKDEEEPESPYSTLLKQMNQKYFNEDAEKSNEMKSNENSHEVIEVTGSSTNLHDFGLRIMNNLDEIPIDSSDSIDDFDSKLNYTKANTNYSNNPISITDCARKEGHLFIKKNDDLFTQVYIKLIDKDMFLFKSKEDKHHLYMKNLNGSFIKSQEEVIYKGKSYYPFTVVFSSIHDTYYASSKKEHTEWVEMLNDITNCRNVNDSYTFEAKLGEGRSGKVHLGKNRLTGESVAIKVVDKQNMTLEEIQLVKTEIKILKICQHPNIIRLHEVFENDKHIYIIMENCTGGDLFSYLQKRHFKLSEKRACKLIHKICTAVYYIHSYGIVHRDVKPENILMTNDSNDADLRIVDFGLSKIIGPNQNILNESYGTISYAAPEVLNGQPYSKAVDIFSIGVLAYLFLSGDLPFEDKCEEEVTRKTINEPHSFKNNHIWNYITKEGRDFVNCCLEKDVTKRIDIKTVLVHPWFKIFLKRRETNEMKGKKAFSSSVYSDFKLYSSSKELLRQYLDSE